MRNIGPIGDQADQKKKETAPSASPAKSPANAAGAFAGMKAEPQASAVSATAAVEPFRIRRFSPSSSQSRSQRTASSAPETPPESRPKRWKWAFPLGIGLAGLASAAAVLLRGCWHSNMSWPNRVSDEHGEFSYQSCNDCGIMRLFDERAFRGYGPYGYDLHALIAHERLLRRQRMHKAAQRQSTGQKTPAPKPPEAPGGAAL